MLKDFDFQPDESGLPEGQIGQPFYALASTQDVQASLSLQSRRQPIAPCVARGVVLTSHSSLHAQATDIVSHDGCRPLRGLGW